MGLRSRRASRSETGEGRKEKGGECDRWIVVCGIALKSVVRANASDKRRGTRRRRKRRRGFLVGSTGAHGRARERERPNLGIISGLARDKPGQRRPNEANPRVNGALRFDSSF